MKDHIKENKTQKIAVIGAGLSGLTAAYRLMQYGLEVDVFEAKDRVGGRVFTVLMENYLGKVTEVELGGQNITDGGEAVHVLGLIKELDLSVQEKVVDLKQLVYSEFGSQYYDELLENHHKNVSDINALIDKAENIGQLIELFCEDNELLQQALFSRMIAYEGLDPYEQSIYHNIETLKCMLSGGIAKAHEFYHHSYDQIVTSFVKGGNALLPLELSKRLQGKVHCNKVLNKIAISDKDAVLTFQDGSVYTYDCVILSIPILAFNNIDLSNAKIEKERLCKIKSIGYGSNYKIAIPLDLREKNDIRYIIKDNTLNFYNCDDTIQLLYVNNKSTDIQAFVKLLSANCDHSLGSSSKEFIEANEQNYKIYKKNVFYNWKNDPYTQGSYSGYSTVISEELDKIEYHFDLPYKGLFSPINNILFFAGEHTTILECIGTMEAAVESGERIAKAIHQLSH